MKKKIFLITLLAVLFVLAFAICVSAAECIDGIYYTFSGTEATVSTDNQKNCELENVVIPEKVTFGGTEYTVTAIAQKAFGSGNASQGNSKVVSVTVPYSVKTVGSYAFANCPSLTTVNSKSTILGSYMFYNCPWVETVTLENTVTISNHVFCNTLSDTKDSDGVITKNNNAKQTNISSLVLPDTVESIGTYAFARCKITSIVIPAKTSTIEGNAFTDCDNLKRAIVLGTTLNTSVFNNCSSMDTLILTENIESGHKDAIKDTVSNFTTYYTGSDPSVIKTLFAGTSRVDKAVAQPYNAEGNYTGSVRIIYNCNLCVVAFDGNHTAIDDGDCTTAVICSMCKKVECKAAMAEHVNGEKLVYTSLLSKGEHFVGCTNDGCKLGTATEVPALFICLGYSTELEGYGIVCEFSVNVDAIEQYQLLVDPNFDYGMVVAIGNSTPLAKDENGIIAPTDKTVVCSFANTEYTKLQIKIANIDEADIDTKIVSTLYVSTNGEISYVNDGKIEKTATGKSYSDLKK